MKSAGPSQTSDIAFNYPAYTKHQCRYPLNSYVHYLLSIYYNVVFFQIMVIFLSFTSNACHSFSGVAVRLQHACLAPHVHAELRHVHGPSWLYFGTKIMPNKQSGFDSLHVTTWLVSGVSAVHWSKGHPRLPAVSYATLRYRCMHAIATYYIHAPATDHH